MDAAQVVTEEPVDKFAGLTFSQACEMLFAKCKSNAPSSEGFQNMIDYIRKVHESMGVEFSCESYWNEGTISGSHEVFPQGLGSDLNTIPDVLTREYLEEMIRKVGGIESANATYRTNHERVSNSRHNPARSGNGTIDTRLLTRNVNTAPIFLAQSSVAEDEDDFI